MQTRQADFDPVSRVIRECHRGEDIATRIYHQIAEEHRRSIVLDGAPVELNEAQAGDFVQRFSSEVEPEYWHSKRRKD